MKVISFHAKGPSDCQSPRSNSSASHTTQHSLHRESQRSEIFERGHCPVFHAASRVHRELRIPLIRVKFKKSAPHPVGSPIDSLWSGHEWKYLDTRRRYRGQWLGDAP